MCSTNRCRSSSRHKAPAQKQVTLAAHQSFLMTRKGRSDRSSDQRCVGMLHCKRYVAIYRTGERPFLRQNKRWTIYLGIFSLLREKPEKIELSLTLKTSINFRPKPQPYVRFRLNLPLLKPHGFCSTSLHHMIE